MPKIRNIIKEQPLFIKINGIPYLAVTRTPGFEKEQAIGICFTSGIIKKIEEIKIIKKNKIHINIIRVSLKTKKIFKSIKTTNTTFKNFISIHKMLQKKTILNNINPHIKKITNTSRLINKTSIKNCKLVKKLLYLKKHQSLRKLTKATHCSIICNKSMKVISLAEDIGRHNSMDKAIGRCLMKKNIKNAKVFFLSSRLSYELVQKASKVEISIIASVSRPSSLAISLAKILNITLLSLSPNDCLIIYSGEKRIIKTE